MSIPTVTVGDAALTPTQAIVADANAITTVTDARGRKIGVRRMTMSIRRRVLKNLRAEVADKDRYVGLIMLAACVVTIDGDPVDAMSGGARDDQREARLDAIIDRLDDEGIAAIAPIVSPSSRTDEEVRDEIKK